MYNFIRVLVLLSIVLSISSCSWLFGDEGYFRDRGNDYLKAKEQAGIPQEELRTYTALAIPEIPSKTLPTEFEVPEPEPLLADQERNAVKIQKLGDASWLLVPLPPEQVWPRVRYFLETNKIEIDGQDVNQGLVETGWLLASQNADLKEKYRIRIEQGVQRNTAEIYLQQIQQMIKLNEVVSWPKEGSINPEREVWMMNQLAQYLANIGEKASVSLMAQGISNASRVTLKKEADKTFIELDLPADRAWASLGNALKKGDFVLDDINRTQGIFYTHRVVDKANKPFFLLRWVGVSSTEERKYQVRMNQVGKSVHIDIANEISNHEEEKILILIKGFLT